MKKHENHAQNHRFPMVLALILLFDTQIGGLQARVLLVAGVALVGVEIAHLPLAQHVPLCIYVKYTYRICVIDTYIHRNYTPLITYIRICITHTSNITTEHEYDL